MGQLANLGRLLLMCLVLLPTNSIASETRPEVTAKSAIVMEVSTGKVLYGKEATERRYPASTTKIMTLITALEYGKLDDVVTASENAASTEGISLHARHEAFARGRIELIHQLYVLRRIQLRHLELPTGALGLRIDGLPEDHRVAHDIPFAIDFLNQEYARGFEVVEPAARDGKIINAADA